MNRKKLYWSCQVAGWFIFLLLNALFIGLKNGFNLKLSVNLVSTFFLGVILSHIFRNIIVKYDWLRNNQLKLIPRFISTAVLISVIHHSILAVIDISFFGSFEEWANNKVNILSGILNGAFVYVAWSLIYFLIHFIENYKKEEIKNLKWEASKNEFELNRLKSQLNPHFIFNSMNSIRALVDENPVKAKDSITQLSSILRSTLLMGKKKVITMEEELGVVNDYLNLESTRYEERLKVELEIDPISYKFKVPPMMLQTLIENGIKHGISKLVDGGKIILKSSVKDDNLYLEIINSGQFNQIENPDTGFGLKNTVQRLKLLYAEKADFTIENLNSKEVITRIKIPMIYESPDN